MANDIVNVEPDDSLKTWGWVSYILHLIRPPCCCCSSRW